MRILKDIYPAYRKAERITAAGATALMLFLTGGALLSDRRIDNVSAAESEPTKDLVDCSRSVRIQAMPGDTIIGIAENKGVDDPYNPYDRINFDIEAANPNGAINGGGGKVPLERFDPVTLKPGDTVIMSDFSKMCHVDGQN